MSPRLGPVYYEHHAEHPFLGQRIATSSATSDATVHLIEEETRRMIAEAHAHAASMIGKHRADVDKLVAALLKEETLEREALEKLLGPPRAYPDLRVSRASHSK
jgi:cell division protease FtsH